MSGHFKKRLDPLYQFFEHYLFSRSYEDSAAFTKEVAKVYVAYLDSTIAHIPFHTRAHVLEDLESETHEMLVKKMFGCVRPSDYANFGKVARAKKGDDLGTFEFEPSPFNEDLPKK